MRLIYHQEIVDRLRQNRIDPQPLIQECEKRLTSDIHPARRRVVTVSTRRMLLRLNRFNQALDNPSFSVQNSHCLDTLEQRYSVILPAAVREWFSLNFVPDLMALRWNFVLQRWNIYTAMRHLHPMDDEDYGADAYSLWCFAYIYLLQKGENSVYVAFKIDGSDDPPIFIHEQQLAPTFSAFILTFFMDWIAELTFPYTFTLYKFVEWFDPTSPVPLPLSVCLPVSNLRQHYHEHAGNLESRLYDDTTWIKYVSEDDRISNAIFRTRTPDQLEQLIDRLWGETSPVLYTETDWHIGSRIILDRLRQIELLKVLRTSGEWMNYSDLTSISSYNGFLFWENLNALTTQGLIEYKPHIDHADQWRSRAKPTPHQE